MMDPFLPIVFCPTDGVYRMLRLPDGTETPGCWAEHRDGWVVQLTETTEPTIEREKNGVIRTIGGHKMRVVKALPDGVYPTHFRPNDTSHGSA